MRHPGVRTLQIHGFELGLKIFEVCRFYTVFLLILPKFLRFFKNFLRFSDDMQCGFPMLGFFRNQKLRKSRPCCNFDSWVKKFHHQTDAMETVGRD